MATKARNGFGTLLQRGDGGNPEQFPTIAEITKVGGPKFARDAIEATHMESPDGFREYIGGLIDAGEIPFEGNWIPRDATQNPTTGLLAEFSSAQNDARNWRIVLPGTPLAYWSFTGILTGHESDQPVDDKMSFQGTIKISGKPTLFIQP